MIHISFRKIEGRRQEGSILVGKKVTLEQGGKVQILEREKSLCTPQNGPLEDLSRLGGCSVGVVPDTQARGPDFGSSAKLSKASVGSVSVSVWTQVDFLQLIGQSASQPG